MTTTWQPGPFWFAHIEGGCDERALRPVGRWSNDGRTDRRDGDRDVVVIAVLLAVLGVPLWLVLGALGGALWSRRRIAAQPGVSRITSLEDGRWARRPSFGQLVHDVLVVSTGVALVRTSVRGVADATFVGAAQLTPPDGFDAVVRVRFDDGSSATYAVDASAVERWRELVASGVGTGGVQGDVGP